VRLLRALALLVLAACSSKVDPLTLIRAADLKTDQVYLASDELEGRESGSEGGRKAAQYISNQCEKLGLRGADITGSTFFVPFSSAGKDRINVLAMRPGSDERLKSEFVVVGAHYDHLGRGQGADEGKIFHGADDNASGASLLLALAKAASRTDFRRTVVFLWFDGEEKGLLGSKAWTEHPTLSLSSCVAMVNCDMVGRNDLKMVQVCVERNEKGEPRYPAWASAIREAGAKFDVTFDWSGADDLIRRSDHWPFMSRGIPAVFFTGGLHADYHTERDLVDRINFQKEELIGKIVFTLVTSAADGTSPIK
jgi:hypothetical protein